MTKIMFKQETKLLTDIQRCFIRPKINRTTFE